MTKKETLDFYLSKDWGITMVYMSYTVGNPAMTHTRLLEEGKPCLTTSYVANLHIAMEHTSAHPVNSHHHLFLEILTHNTFDL